MIELWLSYNNNAERLQLPVNPAEITIGSGSQNSSVSISGVGEVSIIQDPVLKTFEFSSFFPATWGPYCAYKQIPNPWTAHATIERWRRTRRPIRFIMTETPINFAVTVEDFVIKPQAGDVGTLYYDITLHEYRFIRPRKLEQKKVDGKDIVTTDNTSSRPNNKERPDNYTVKNGDSLWEIAKKYLEDGSRYKEIASLNSIKSPYTIHPGDILKLPKG
ncbi:MAG: LysM peptidoglycan-binding domain-containing protein [Candidatus Pristimantibacillus sp.]